MVTKKMFNRFKTVLVLFALFFSTFAAAQEKKDVQIPDDVILENQTTDSQNSEEPTFKEPFWSHVQFGGGFALGISTGYTEITLAPSVIYNHNKYLATGFGLQGSYVNSKGYYNSKIYGANIIELINPIPQIQLSVSLSESRVNNVYDVGGGAHISENFWVTGLFLGAGYCTGNVTIGMTYNVLHDDYKDLYGNAFMPFIRIYF